MKKMKRSARIVDLTHYLLRRPHQLVPLTIFSDRYQSAKSSISEDLAIVREVFHQEGIGELMTVAGASGGVRYTPMMSENDAKSLIQELCQKLQQSDRLLPGGYLYMADILGKPSVLQQLGRMFATIFAKQQLDVVMTVETKGIPLAYATAEFLNLPVVIVRRDNKVTEGSAVSIQYVSGSNKQIQTMSLARRALKEHANVLIIDDFMRAGGTVHGMVNLLQEFKANICGVGIFIESAEAEEHLVEDYVSLAKLSGVDMKTREIRIRPGNYFQ